MPSLVRIIRVEFYGIPRARAGVAETIIELKDDGMTLANVLANLAAKFPPLAVDCLGDKGLRDGYVANIHGERFVRRMDEVLRAGDTLLIFSADAGG